MTPTPFVGLIKRDIALGVRQGGATGLVLAFFLMVIALFPFGVGPDLSLLARISVGILWVTVLLASLLSLDRLFQSDLQDGTLDDLLLSPLSLEMIVVAKAMAHWLATIVPLIALAPILGGLLNLPQAAYGVLIASLLLGTPALSFIGSIAAALTLTVNRGGVLVALLILPLNIPTLIFGVGAVNAAMNGLSPLPQLALLTALSLFTALISPYASAAAIKMSLE